MVGDLCVSGSPSGSGARAPAAALMPTSIRGAQREWPGRNPRRGEGHPHPLPGPCDRVPPGRAPTDPQPPGKGLGRGARWAWETTECSRSGGREVAAAARRQRAARAGGVQGGSDRLRGWWGAGTPRGGAAERDRHRGSRGGPPPPRDGLVWGLDRLLGELRPVYSAHDLWGRKTLSSVTPS